MSLVEWLKKLCPKGGEEMKVTCEQCKKKVKLVEKLGGLICERCRKVLYYRHDSMMVIKSTKKPKNMEYGK